MKQMFILMLLPLLIAGCQTGPTQAQIEDARIQAETDRMNEQFYKRRAARQAEDEANWKAQRIEEDRKYQAQQKDYAERREAYFKAHPDLKPAIREAILDDWFVVGMTAEEVKLSMGPPNDKNISQNAYHRSEQWVYGHYLYLYLTDGVVTSFQQSVARD